MIMIMTSDKRMMCHCIGTARLRCYGSHISETAAKVSVIASVARIYIYTSLMRKCFN